MSASTSCSERARAALAAIRRGETVPDEEVRSLGEECPAEFFRIIVEALADSFDPSDAAAYERLMRVWIPETTPVSPVIPDRVEEVYVLSRVTLGSDIKITSVVLAAMKKRFPDARIVLVGGRKSAEIFAGDQRIEHLEANYPRSGPVSLRLQFAHDLRRSLEGEHRIVVDPDSRMTQLGLVPACPSERYFHFRSRTAQPDSIEDLSELVRNWLKNTFGVAGSAFVAPEPVEAHGERPWAAISLGVGGNDTKRIAGDFEARMIKLLGERYRTIWIDRGAGGEEAALVTAAAEASGAKDLIKFWEGSFAGFASIISQSDLYVGYDSAGQHAAAATRTRLITVFAGAASTKFRQRWAPSGNATVIDADTFPPEMVLEKISNSLPRTPEEIDQLRAQIAAAFPLVSFEEDVTSCTCDECTDMRNSMRHKKWSELTSVFLDDTCSPTLLQIQAAQIFLPAWLLRGLDTDAPETVAEFTLYSVCLNEPGDEELDPKTHAIRSNRLQRLRELMTPEQVAVVRSWLFAIAAANEGYFAKRVAYACDLVWR